MANGDEAVITKETFVNIWGKDDARAQGEILYDLLDSHFRRIVRVEKRVSCIEQHWGKIAGAITLVAFALPLLLKFLL